MSSACAPSCQVRPVYAAAWLRPAATPTLATDCALLTAPQPHVGGVQGGAGQEGGARRGAWTAQKPCDAAAHCDCDQQYDARARTHKHTCMPAGGRGPGGLGLPIHGRAAHLDEAWQRPDRAHNGLARAAGRPPVGAPRGGGGWVGGPCTPRVHHSAPAVGAGPGRRRLRSSAAMHRLAVSGAHRRGAWVGLRARSCRRMVRMPAQRSLHLRPLHVQDPGVVSEVRKWRYW